MDCAYVARQRVFVANRPEDLAHYPLVLQEDHQQHSDITRLNSNISLTTNSVIASCLPSSVEDTCNSASPSSATSSFNVKSCKCIIDISNREALHRDFYNWLQGNEPNHSQERPCVFDELTLDSTTPPSTSNDPNFYGPDSTFLADNGSSTATAYIVDSQPLQQLLKQKRQKRSIKKEPIEEDIMSVSGENIDEKPKKKRGTTNRGTNLYGRAYCPGRPLSMEERYQIICLFQAGMKVNAISKQLCISHGCVSKIITRFRETGLLQPSSHAECRRRKRLMEAAQQQQQQLNQSMNPMNTG